MDIEKYGSLLVEEDELTFSDFTFTLTENELNYEASDLEHVASILVLTWAIKKLGETLNKRVEGVPFHNKSDLH